MVHAGPPRGWRVDRLGRSSVLRLLEGVSLMIAAKAMGRWIIVAIVTLCALIAGLSVPTLLQLSQTSLTSQAPGLVAAPRQAIRLFAPVRLGEKLGLVVRTGVISLETPGGQRLAEADRQRLLMTGSAALNLKYGEVALFDILLSGARADAADAGDTPATKLATAPLEQTLRKRRFETLLLDQSSVVIATPAGQTIRLRSQSLKLSPKSDGGFTLAGMADWRGSSHKVLIDAGAASAKSTNDGKSETVIPLRLAFRSDVFELTFVGQLIAGAKKRLVGKMAFDAPALPDAVRALGLSLSGFTAISAFQLDADLDWTGQQIAFRNSKLELDRQSASGALSVNLVGERPRLGGSLDFDTLDLAAFKFESEPRDVLPKRVLASFWNLFEGAGTTRLDMDLRFSAEDVRFADLSLGRGAASLLLSNGLLKAHIAELKVAEGVGTAQLSVNFDAPRPSLAIRGKLENADFEKLTKTAVGKSVLLGRGHARFDLTAAPGGPIAIARSLDGQIGFELDDGGTVSLNLAPLLAKVVAGGDADEAATVARGGASSLKPTGKVADGVNGLSPSEQLAKQVLNGGTTGFSEFRLDLKLKSGRAVCEKFSLTADGATFTGRGRIDLWSQRLSGRAVLRRLEGKTGPADRAILLSGSIGRPALHQAPIEVDFEREVLGGKVPDDPAAEQQSVQ